MFHSREDAINFYLPKKINNEMDLSSIKSELQQQHRFNEEDIKFISREISDQELESINKKKSPLFGFFDHLIYSYIMAVAAILAITLSIIKMYLTYRIDPASYIERFDIAPLIFISGGILLYAKHHLRIKKYKKNN